MPTIARLRNSKIQIFADDHNPPHFRLIGPHSNAQVAIRTLKILAGKADRRDLREALAYAREHQTELLKAWRRLNERG
jgi:hypothetical protein